MGFGKQLFISRYSCSYQHAATSRKATKMPANDKIRHAWPIAGLAGEGLDPAHITCGRLFCVTQPMRRPCSCWKLPRRRSRVVRKGDPLQHLCEPNALPGDRREKDQQAVAGQTLPHERPRLNGKGRFSGQPCDCPAVDQACWAGESSSMRSGSSGTMIRCSRSSFGANIG